jgi:hypothetical protein
MRASHISVTVAVKDKSESYGFALAQVQDEKDTVQIDLMVENGLLHQSSVEEGDIIKTVTYNSSTFKVTDCKDVLELLIGLEGPVTITAETAQINSAVQAFCRKPTKETMVGIGFKILEHGDHNLLQINYLDPNGFLANLAL